MNDVYDDPEASLAAAHATAAEIAANPPLTVAGVRTCSISSASPDLGEPALCSRVELGVPCRRRISRSGVTRCSRSVRLQFTGE